MPARFLSEADVASLIDMPTLIPAIAEVFRKHALLEVENIPRQRVRTDHAMLHLMGAAAKTLGAFVVKAYTSSRAGLQFFLHLYDGQTGSLRAVLAGDWLGALRTGAMSAVATQQLARPEAATVGLIGCGRQAETQLMAMVAVRPIQAIRVYCRRPDQRGTFAERLAGKLAITVTPVDSAEAAVSGQDIVITATTASEPVLWANWLAPGTHINAIGANFLTKSELDPQLVARSAPIIVDDLEQARLEAGDLALARREGCFEWVRAHSLAQLLVGRAAGRTMAEEITLFKSVGVAYADLAAALLVVNRAEAAGVGVELPF